MVQHFILQVMVQMLNFNSVEPTEVHYNGVSLDTVYMNGIEVWSGSIEYGLVEDAVYDSSFDNGQASIRTMSFNNDGTKLYYSSQSTDKLYQYSLSISYDITSGTLDGNHSFNSEETMLSGFCFSYDGLTCFMTGSGNDIICQYSVSVAHDITSTITLQKSVTPAEGENQRGLAISKDGMTMFSITDSTNSLHQYNLASPNDIENYTLEFTYGELQTGRRDLHLSIDGHYLFIACSSTNLIYQIQMTVPFDLSTGTTLSTLDISSFTTIVGGVSFNGDASKMFLTSDVTDSLTATYIMP